MKPMSSGGKFALLSCLYFSQGLPYGFFNQVLPVIMREENASLEAIGLTSLLALPWMLKFLWAPLVDRYGHGGIGHKKSWILALQGLGVLLFAFLGLFAVEQGYMFLVYGYLCANLIAATQDIATDGMAVDLLEPRERGLGNGLQVAGYRLGMILGGGLILMLLEVAPRRLVFWSMSLWLLVATLPLFYYKEPARILPKLQAGVPSLLWRYLKRPGVLLWLVVIGGFKFGDAMTTQMLRPFLVDLGWEKTAIGGFNSLGSLGGLAGALIGGLAVKYGGRYRAIVGFGILQTAGVLGYYLICVELLPSSWLYTIGIAEHLTGGMATAALFTAMMDTCREGSSATDYTVQASVVVMTTGAAHALSGFTAGALGYAGNFLLSGCLCLLGALVFGLIYRTQASERGAFELS